MKVGLIVTILNEQESIVALLESIVQQTVLPAEVVIVDGGSTDQTLARAKAFLKNKAALASKTTFRILQKKGNRSVGRNYAVSQLQSDWVACTDAGCVLDSHWLEQLCDKQQKSNALVVAGYYQPLAHSVFEQAVACYALVNPKYINQFSQKVFLPATRSMLISKKLFTAMGGFDEVLSDNEDYVFAKKLVSTHAEAMTFAPKAIVFWRPVSTIGAFYTMIYRFARGDSFAGILRPKVLTIYARYLFFIWLGMYAFELFLIVFAAYMLWAIWKNASFAKKGWYFLPMLQIISDFAVMIGSVHGQLRVLTIWLSAYTTKHAA